MGFKNGLNVYTSIRLFLIDLIPVSTDEVNPNSGFNNNTLRNVPIYCNDIGMVRGLLYVPQFSIRTIDIFTYKSSPENFIHYIIRCFIYVTNHL